MNAQEFPPRLWITLAILGVVTFASLWLTKKAGAVAGLTLIGVGIVGIPAYFVYPDMKVARQWLRDRKRMRRESRGLCPSCGYDLTEI